jgi:nucleobase:cation symporter-1, NCS1 family
MPFSLSEQSPGGPGRSTATVQGAQTGEPIIAGSNPVFGVEIRGFEHIPDAERNMTLAQVGPLWLGSNLNVLSIILGCVPITLGLSLWWALAACIAGNLPYIYLGIGCIGTVRAGLPVTTLSRAVFGIRGNFFNALCAWIASVAYEVIGTVFGVYALLAMFKLADWHGSDSVQKLLAILLQLALCGGVAMLGHATMVYLQRFAAVALGAVLVLVLAHTCGSVDWTHAGLPRLQLSTPSMVAAFMTACGVMASQPIGYLFNGPDWVRYLPTRTPGRQIFGRVFWWTFLPSVIVTAMGAMWASLGDMSDPVAGLKPLLPRWLFIAYVLAVIVGSLAANVPVFYSSGLSLQSLGLKVKRWIATMIDVVISTALVGVIVFVADFTSALNDFVALLLVWVGPYGAIWICDGYRRRWVYAVGTIHRTAHASHTAAPDRRLPGWIALAAGMLVGALTMRSPIFDGPIAKALSGADLNWVLGFLVAGGTYLAMTSSAPLHTKPDSTNSAI